MDTNEEIELDFDFKVAVAKVFFMSKRGRLG